MHYLFTRARLCAIAVAVAFTYGTSGPVIAADHQELGMIGKWHVTKALDSAEISSLDDREAQRLIGKVFTINKKTVKLGRVDDWLPPRFEAKLVETARYVRN